MTGWNLPPECPVCQSFGDLRYYPGHGLTLSADQTLRMVENEHQAELLREEAMRMAADTTINDDEAENLPWC